MDICKGIKLSEWECKIEHTRVPKEKAAKCSWEKGGLFHSVISVTYFLIWRPYGDQMVPLMKLQGIRLSFSCFLSTILFFYINLCRCSTFIIISLLYTAFLCILTYKHTQHNRQKYLLNTLYQPLYGIELW